MFHRWGELKNYISKKLRGAVILPLYLYDHSGITMNTTGFSCPWDSGQVGFIYTTRDKIRKWFGKRKTTPELLEKARESLVSEVKTYDKYLCGESYGFRIYKNDEEIDSCWGYDDIDYCMTEAESTISSI